MINVIAIIKVKKGNRSAFLDIFKANVPKVRQEEGCLEYYPTVDIESGLGAQDLAEDTVTIIEKWASVEALKAHLSSPHMLTYKEDVKDLVESVSLKVLQQA